MSNILAALITRDYEVYLGCIGHLKFTGIMKVSEWLYKAQLLTKDVPGRQLSLAFKLQKGLNRDKSA